MNSNLQCALDSHKEIVENVKFQATTFPQISGPVKLGRAYEYFKQTF